jgi:hypothetical protein
MAEPFNVIDLSLAVFLAAKLEGQHFRTARQPEQPGG